jgi:putative membrane protein
MMPSKTIVIASILLFITSWFTVWQKELSFPVVSAVMTVLLALPAIYGCYVWLGRKRAVLLLISLGLFSYGIECFGLLTGFPYGTFSYTENVGILLFDLLPLTLPFAWVPLLLGAYVLAHKQTKNAMHRYLLTIAYLLAIDLVLDPGAVFLGFWEYAATGIWYGVPFTNFLGWIVSGSIGYLILRQFLKNNTSTPPKLLLISYWFSVVFWTGICLFGSLWGGAIVGASLLWHIRRRVM